MSKSLGNVINPDEYIQKFGADSTRLYEMFMGPFDQAIAWDDNGVIGVYRFIEKLWRLFDKSEPNHADSKNILTILNQTIKKVSRDIEHMCFNTAISHMMILCNALSKEEKISQETLELFLKIISPFAPHIAEELWEYLGHKKSIVYEQWPQYNETLIHENEIELVIQINGKVRDKINLPADIPEDEAKNHALNSPKIKPYLTKEPSKVLYIPKKLVNIVI